MMDRPHILYNAGTKKYVCWLKIMEPAGGQASTILTADSILGPYTMVRTGLRPLGMSAGDFDLAAAHFTRRGKHYLLTSGTTGYKPNPSEAAVADTWHGPYTVLGDPHPSDTSRTSFHSQISSVFKVPGKRDLYIALADRWIPDHMEWEYSEYEKFFRKLFDPEFRGDFTDPGWIGDTELDTSRARYVWLPIRFEDDRPVID